MNVKLRQSGLRNRRRRCGLSLMEQVVVVAAIALLVAVSLPAVRSFIKSIEAQGGSKAMLNAALASARATAAQQQRYAGIRFQYAYYKGDPCNSPLKAPQYMIFIVQDFDATNLANGFRAVEGVEPIKLPDNVGVMEVVNGDGDIDIPTKLINKTTFSIIFSPSGKLIIHDVRTKGITSKDDVFNTNSNVQNGIGMFVQDSANEASRNSFRIYDRDIFGKVNVDDRVTGYLQDVDVVYINPYTGTIIDR
ncbi:MAG: hypothetical protein JW947_03400 [Sedimentisphaerales bacterium]|nr:hypothetical protein [Sedimentisphaerales bacterium]